MNIMILILLTINEYSEEDKERCIPAYRVLIWSQGGI